MAGISLRHGTHHVAQKLRSTTLPRSSVRLREAPDGVDRVKSGAGGCSPTGVVAVPPAGACSAKRAWACPREAITPSETTRANASRHRFQSCRLLSMGPSIRSQPVRLPLPLAAWGALPRNAPETPGHISIHQSPHRGIPPSPYRPMACATTSRCRSASPYITSPCLARRK